MRVLVACEYSGRVRRAFTDRGHVAISCDLLPPDDGNTLSHYQGDVFDIIEDGWDLMVAHPPCTYLCSSGLHWNSRVEGRAAKTEEALDFVRRLIDAPIPRKVIENPRGRIGTAIRKADQVIHPYQFGHDASKATCLWLENLPQIVPTSMIGPRMVEGKDGVLRPRWANQTDSGQNRLTPSDDRWKLRSETYEGIAEAMADQWGRLPALGYSIAA